MDTGLCGIKMEPITTDRFLRIRDVQSRTTLSRSTIYRLASLGQFPKPVKLGERASAWPESAVRDWIAGRIEAAQQEGVA